MITDEMVKRAASEYLLHKGEAPWRVLRRGAELWEDHAPAMRAALTAALSGKQEAVAPEGWRLVPNEPTPEMIDAAYDELWKLCDDRSLIAHALKWAIDAAPSPALKGGEDE